LFSSASSCAFHERELYIDELATIKTAIDKVDSLKHSSFGECFFASGQKLPLPLFLFSAFHTSVLHLTLIHPQIQFQSSVPERRQYDCSFTWVTSSSSVISEVSAKRSIIVPVSVTPISPSVSISLFLFKFYI